MKIKFILLLSICCLLSCNKEESQEEMETMTQTYPLEGVWNLMRVDRAWVSPQEYEEGQVVLTVGKTDYNFVNNVDSFTLNHVYSILEVDEKSYLLLDGKESGEIVFFDNGFYFYTANFSTGNELHGDLGTFKKIN